MITALCIAQAHDHDRYAAFVQPAAMQGGGLAGLGYAKPRSSRGQDHPGEGRADVKTFRGRGPAAGTREDLCGRRRSSRVKAALANGSSGVRPAAGREDLCGQRRRTSLARWPGSALPRGQQHLASHLQHPGHSDTHRLTSKPAKLPAGHHKIDVHPPREHDNGMSRAEARRPDILAVLPSGRHARTSGGTGGRPRETRAWGCRRPGWSGRSAAHRRTARLACPSSSVQPSPRASLPRASRRPRASPSRRACGTPR